MKNPVKSKKGLTLVELVAASAISVIIMAAACTMFFVGSKSAQNGATAFVNHGDAYVLETQLRNNLFKAYNISAVTGASNVPAPDSNNNIMAVHFDSDGVLWIKTDSTDSAQQISIAADGIKKFKLSEKNDGAKHTLLYNITAENSDKAFELSGGIVMNNLKPPVALLDDTQVQNTETDKNFIMKIPRK